MKGFQSICFIHTMKDSYLSCYMKQFFKWIGFSYFALIPGSLGVEEEILLKQENRKFDFVVDLNHALHNYKSDLKEIYKERLIELELNRDESKTIMMARLMEHFHQTVLRGYHTDVLKKLFNIYEDCNMTKLLYEYTFILLNKNDTEMFHEIDESYQKVLARLNQMEEDSKQIRPVDRQMWEYFLYAKYFSQRKVNELCRLNNWILEFPVEKMITDIEEIYQYDPGFYRAEYLKAKAAEQSLIHQIYAKEYYYKAIQQSTIGVCKSYLFYQMGKGLERNRQFEEAGRAYLLSFQSNPANVKAIFKIVVDFKKKNEWDLQKKYLLKLIQNWELFQNQKQMVPLMELEYTYKAYMLMDELERVNMQDVRFYSVAREILDFTKDLVKSAGPDSYVKQLYVSPDIVRKICTTMASRMDINCWEEEN